MDALQSSVLLVLALQSPCRIEPSRERPQSAAYSLHAASHLERKLFEVFVVLYIRIDRLSDDFCSLCPKFLPPLLVFILPRLHLLLLLEIIVNSDCTIIQSTLCLDLPELEA